MAKRKRQKTYHNYSCTITGDSYKLTRKVDNADDLVSINAYYELHPEKDDRPVAIKKKLGIDADSEES